MAARTAIRPCLPLARVREGERVDIALIAAIIATQFFYAWAALGMEGLE